MTTSRKTNDQERALLRAMYNESASEENQSVVTDVWFPATVTTEALEPVGDVVWLSREEAFLEFNRHYGMKPLVLAGKVGDDKCFVEEVGHRVHRTPTRLFPLPESVILLAEEKSKAKTFVAEDRRYILRTMPGWQKVESNKKGIRIFESFMKKLGDEFVAATLFECGGWFHSVVTSTPKVVEHDSIFGVIPSHVITRTIHETAGEAGEAHLQKKSIAYAAKDFDDLTENLKAPEVSDPVALTEFILRTSGADLDSINDNTLLTAAALCVNGGRAFVLKEAWQGFRTCFCSDELVVAEQVLPESESKSTDATSRAAKAMESTLWKEMIEKSSLSAHIQKWAREKTSIDEDKLFKADIVDFIDDEHLSLILAYGVRFYLDGHRLDFHKNSKIAFWLADEAKRIAKLFRIDPGTGYAQFYKKIPEFRDIDSTRLIQLFRWAFIKYLKEVLNRASANDGYAGTVVAESSEESEEREVTIDDFKTGSSSGGHGYNYLKVGDIWHPALYDLMNGSPVGRRALVKIGKENYIANRGGSPQTTFDAPYIQVLRFLDDKKKAQGDLSESNTWVSKRVVGTEGRFIPADLKSYKSGPDLSFKIAFGGTTWTFADELDAKIFSDILESFPDGYGFTLKISTSASDKNYSVTAYPEFSQVDVRPRALSSSAIASNEVGDHIRFIVMNTLASGMATMSGDIVSIEGKSKVKYLVDLDAKSKIVALKDLALWAREFIHKDGVSEARARLSLAHKTPGGRFAESASSHPSIASISKAVLGRTMIDGLDVGVWAITSETTGALDCWPVESMNPIEDFIEGGRRLWTCDSDIIVTEGVVSKRCTKCNAVYIRHRVNGASNEAGGVCEDCGGEPDTNQKDDIDQKNSAKVKRTDLDKKYGIDPKTKEEAEEMKGLATNLVWKDGYFDGDDRMKVPYGQASKQGFWTRPLGRPILIQDLELNKGVNVDGMPSKEEIDSKEQVVFTRWRYADYTHRSTFGPVTKHDRKIVDKVFGNEERSKNGMLAIVQWSDKTFPVAIQKLWKAGYAVHFISVKEAQSLIEEENGDAGVSESYTTRSGKFQWREAPHRHGGEICGLPGNMRLVVEPDSDGGYSWLFGSDHRGKIGNYNAIKHGNALDIETAKLNAQQAYSYAMESYVPSLDNSMMISDSITIPDPSDQPSYVSSEGNHTFRFGQEKSARDYADELKKIGYDPIVTPSENKAGIWIVGISAEKDVDQPDNEPKEPIDEPKDKSVSEAIAAPPLQKKKADIPGTEAPLADDKIRLLHTATDGHREEEEFVRLGDAQAWAINRVGRFPELAASAKPQYAVSTDGINVVSILSGGIQISDLFDGKQKIILSAKPMENNRWGPYLGTSEQKVFDNPKAAKKFVHQFLGDEAKTVDTASFYNQSWVFISSSPRGQISVPQNELPDMVGPEDIFPDWRWTPSVKPPSAEVIRAFWTYTTELWNSAGKGIEDEAYLIARLWNSDIPVPAHRVERVLSHIAKAKWNVGRATEQRRTKERFEASPSDVVAAIEKLIGESKQQSKPPAKPIKENKDLTDQKDTPAKESSNTRGTVKNHGDWNGKRFYIGVAAFPSGKVIDVYTYEELEEGASGSVDHLLPKDQVEQTDRGDAFIFVAQRGTFESMMTARRYLDNHRTMKYEAEIEKQIKESEAEVRSQVKWTDEPDPKHVGQIHKHADGAIDGRRSKDARVVAQYFEEEDNYAEYVPSEEDVEKHVDPETAGRYHDWRKEIDRLKDSVVEILQRHGGKMKVRWSYDTMIYSLKDNEPQQKTMHSLIKPGVKWTPDNPPKPYKESAHLPPRKSVLDQGRRDLAITSIWTPMDERDRHGYYPITMKPVAPVGTSALGEASVFEEQPWSFREAIDGVFCPGCRLKVRKLYKKGGKHICLACTGRKDEGDVIAE